MAGLASINIRFSADLKEFSSKMQNATRSIKKMGKQLTKVGKGLSVGITAPLVALAAVSINTFAGFEQSMAKVKAVSGATGASFAALEKSALDLGAATRYTAEQVSTLQLNYSKLGFSPDEIIQVTAATLDLALATGEDLATSATVAASTLRGFGLDVSEMNHLVDVMAKSFSSSALDLEKFQNSMGSLAPVAKNAGVSIEEATSYLSILVDRGVDASTAGTGLRNIFLDLAGSGETLQSAMLRISTSTNKNKVAFDSFGKRGATVAAIMADNSKEAKILEDSYINSAGAAKAMAGIVNNVLQGSLLKMKSALEAAAISLGKELSPYVKKLTVFIADLANKFTALSPETKKYIVIIASLAAVIGPLLMVLGLLMTSVIPGLITGVGYLSAAFTSLTAVIAANPFGALAVAIAAIASYFIFFNNSVDTAASKQALFTEVNDKAIKSIAGEKAKLTELLVVARDENIQKTERLKAIKELNELSPKYLGDLTLEKINTDKAKSAIELYNKELFKTAKIKAARNVLITFQEKKLKQEIKHGVIQKELAAEWAKQWKEKAEGVIRIEHIEEAIIKTKLENSAKVLTALKAEEKQILKIIKANKTSIIATPTTTTTTTTTKPADFKGKKVTALDISFNIGDTVALGVENLDNALKSMETRITFFKANVNILTDGISSSFAVMGGQIAAVFETGNAVLDAFVGTIINSLSNLASAFVNQLLIERVFSTAKKSLDYGKSASSAIVVATSAAAAMGPAGVFALPALIASQVGLVSGAFAGIQAFASGGIMGGNSYSGDRLFARINSGEMILNKRQQNNVAAGLGAARQDVNIQLVGGIKTSGRDLIFFLEQEANRLNRVR